MSGSPYVSWDVDHPAKKIRVKVRIDFYFKPGTSPGLRKLLEGRMRDALRAAERRWKGRFKCYDFELEVDEGFVAGHGAVRADALDVLLDGELMGYGQTRTKGPHGEELSEDPKDAIVPERSPAGGGPDDISAWPDGENIVAHEIGHVIGLDDGYRNKWWGLSDDREPKPGHPADIMQDPSLSVLPSTITRAVRRQFGTSLESAMTCPLALESGPARFDLLLASLDDLRLEARAERYDPPTADPAAPPSPTSFTGSFRAKGEYLTRFPVPWQASGDGSWPVKFEVDLGKEPIQLRIDLGFWVLRQMLHWDPVTSLPYADGPLLIEADGATLDSTMLFPGPPLYARFSDPDRPAPA